MKSSAIYKGIVLSTWFSVLSRIVCIVNMPYHVCSAVIDDKNVDMTPLHMGAELHQ